MHKDPTADARRCMGDTAMASEFAEQLTADVIEAFFDNRPSANVWLHRMKSGSWNATLFGPYDGSVCGWGGTPHAAMASAERLYHDRFPDLDTAKADRIAELQKQLSALTDLEAVA